MSLPVGNALEVFNGVSTFEISPERHDQLEAFVLNGCNCDPIAKTTEFDALANMGCVQRVQIGNPVDGGVSRVVVNPQLAHAVLIDLYYRKPDEIIAAAVNIVAEASARIPQLRGSQLAEGVSKQLWGNSLLTYYDMMATQDFMGLAVLLVQYADEAKRLLYDVAGEQSESSAKMAHARFSSLHDFLYNMFQAPALLGPVYGPTYVNAVRSRSPLERVKASNAYCATEVLVPRTVSVEV